MKNVFFPDEVITKEDVFYVCSLIERIARRLKQPNWYVVNCMGKQALAEKFPWQMLCTAKTSRLSLNV